MEHFIFFPDIASHRVGSGSGKPTVQSTTVGTEKYKCINNNFLIKYVQIYDIYETSLHADKCLSLQL